MQEATIIIGRFLVSIFFFSNGTAFFLAATVTIVFLILLLVVVLVLVVVVQRKKCSHDALTEVSSKKIASEEESLCMTLHVIFP